MDAVPSARLKRPGIGLCVGTSKNGAPGAIPTRDLPLRRRTLYAAELREHKETNVDECTGGELFCQLDAVNE